MALLTSDRKPRSLLQSAELFSYILISDLAHALKTLEDDLCQKKKSSSLLSSGVSHGGPSKNGQKK